MSASFKKPAAPPRDYFVPNFGVDKDILMTDLNIGEAEAQHSHQLTVEKPAAPIPRNYFVPNFGKDADIKDSEADLKLAEEKVGQPMSDAYLAQPKPHPTGYFVPNFGMDREIQTSLSNTAGAE